ncbi:MAG TPA: hypothetical protein VFX21_12150, partial [Acidimicrobiia bacterium]|nr:hypothetical protein [Acidimicrobiia bacterium]
MTITKRIRASTVNVALLAIGLLASFWLLYFEGEYHAELVLGIVAVGALVALDQRDDPRFTIMTALMPFIVLLDIADVFYDPTRGIVVQGAEVGALVALLAVGIALIYRANRVINFAQGDLGAAPAIFVLLLIAKDAPGGAPDWMTGLPYPVAFVLGLISAVFLGFVVERLIIN